MQRLSRAFVIGTTAFIDKNGLGVFDRDQSGQLVASHNATSFSAWGIAKPYQIYQPSFDVTSSGTYNFTEWAPGSAGQTNNPDNYNAVSYTSLNLARPDGFSIAATGAGTVLGELTFQGVRAYDSTTSQWASPDFYAGDVNDPGSQRPFMWNGNNPLQYSDPSGYLSWEQQAAIEGVDAALLITGRQSSALACTEFVNAMMTMVGSNFTSDGNRALLLSNPFRHGWSSQTYMNDVGNMHQYMAAAGELSQFKEGMAMQAGDIVFEKDSHGIYDHVAMIGSVDKDGKPLSIIESDGNGHVLAKSWADFEQASHDQGKKIDSVGRVPR